MKNALVCKLCNEENPIYHLNCKNCKGFLRDKISNINFWFVTAKLLESPTEAFKTIIHSEHKNFVFLLTLLISLKMMLQNIFISTFILDIPVSNLDNAVYGSMIIIVTTLTIYVLSWFLYVLLKIFKIETRVKDNYSIIAYSLVGYVFSVIVLFPIELILFGGSLFQITPSPFFLKPLSAYLMVAFESIVFLWCFFLLSRGVFTQSKNLSFSLVISLIFHIILFTIPIIILLSILNSAK